MLTKRQIECLRLVGFQSLTQAEAAERMKISQPAVSRLMERIYAKISIPRKENITSPKKLSFDETRDYKIKRKF